MKRHNIYANIVFNTRIALTLKNTLMKPNELELTGVFVQDTAGAGYTAFFAQLPNIIAEGDTESEAAQNLIEAVRSVFEHQKNIDFKQDDICKNSQITTKSYNLAFA